MMRGFPIRDRKLLPIHRLYVVGILQSSELPVVESMIEQKLSVNESKEHVHLLD